MYSVYVLSAFLFLSILIFEWRARRLSVYEPMFWMSVFYFITFIVRPCLVWWFGYTANFEYMKFAPDGPTFFRTVLVAMVGYVSFFAGMLLVRRRELEGVYLEESVTSGQKRLFVVFCVIAIPFAAYSFKSTMGEITGERVGGTYILVGTTGYIIDAQMLFLPISLLIWRMTRPNPIGVLLTLVIVGYWFIFMRVRWQAITFLISFACYYCAKRRLRLPLVALMTVAPVALIAFLLKGANRMVFQQAVAGDFSGIVDGLTLDGVWTALEGQDFGNFDFLNYIVAVVPDGTGRFTNFTQWLQIFTEPIPRMLWSSKPIGAPIVYFDLNDYGNFIGLTPSIFGDGWMSRGYLGVFLTCGFLGALLGWIRNLYIPKLGNVFYRVSFFILCGILFQLYRDGGISILKFALFTVVPPLLLGALDERINRRRS